MNKLRKKLTLTVSIIIIAVFTLTIIFNNFFLSKFYLYNMKGDLKSAFLLLKDNNYERDDMRINEIQNKYNLSIVFVKNTNDIDSLNYNLISELGKKGVVLNKIWLTQDVVNNLIEGKTVNKIYNQDKLKTSFLIKFARDKDTIIALGTSVTHDSDTIRIANKFYLYLIMISIILIIILVSLFSKRITSPLEELSQLTKDIALLDFKKVDIRTGDEIEDLSNSINIMSEELEKAHNNLQKKNTNLKHLIASASHEFKTPLALIKAYSIGINDGMDDGSYTEIIVEQVDSISKLVDDMLMLSKIEIQYIKPKKIDIKHLLLKTLDSHKLTMQNKRINLHVDIENVKNSIILFEENQLEMIFNNFITNAIKYNCDNEIYITLKEEDEAVFFSIKNKVHDMAKTQLQKLWQPFYIRDKDKNQGGNGLGLFIVKSILEKNNVTYGAFLKDNCIEFYMNLKTKE